MEAPTIISHFLFTCVRNSRALNVQWINGLECNYLRGIQYCVLNTSFQWDSLGHSMALECAFSAVNRPLETAFKCKISQVFFLKIWFLQKGYSLISSTAASHCWLTQCAWKSRPWQGEEKYHLQFRERNHSFCCWNVSQESKGHKEIRHCISFFPI